MMSNVTTGRRDVEVSAKHVSYKPYIIAHMIGKDIACNIPPSPVVNLPRQHSLSAHMWLPRSCTATGGDSMSTAFLSLAQHKAKERQLATL